MDTQTTRRALLLQGSALAACALRAPTREATMSERAITHTTRGQRHGFLRRVVSPGDLGEAMKPFIFLDHFRSEVRPGMGFPMHPHSGIATVSYVLDADATYEDTTGKQGVLRARGVEWMQSGGGVWHTGGVVPSATRVNGFQLWVALPPSHEEAPAASQYVPPEEVPEVDGVRVILGAYQGHQNPVPLPMALAYLDVSLRDGQRWTYRPPPGHDVAWAFVHEGAARVSGSELVDTLAVFERSEAPVVFEARGPTRMLFGSAVRHDHPLVLGTSSVHTDRGALSRSLRRIAALGETLRAQGRLG